MGYFQTNNQEIERQDVVFVEPEKSQNNEIIDKSCNRFETQTDPSDNPPDFDISANIVSPLTDSKGWTKLSN